MMQKFHEKMEINKSHVNGEDKESCQMQKWLLHYWLIDWKDLLVVVVVADDEKRAIAQFVLMPKPQQK